MLGGSIAPSCERTSVPSRMENRGVRKRPRTRKLAQLFYRARPRTRRTSAFAAQFRRSEEGTEYAAVTSTQA